MKRLSSSLLSSCFAYFRFVTAQKAPSPEEPTAVIKPVYIKAPDAIPLIPEPQIARPHPKSIGIAIVNDGPTTKNQGFCFAAFLAGGPSISTGSVYKEEKSLGERLK